MTKSRTSCGSWPDATLPPQFRCACGEGTLTIAGMGPLADGFGRIVTNLRISVTDRCNLRCIYCMPADPVWIPRDDVLTFDEIVRFLRIGVSLGVRKVRITGGEPTVRKGICELVRMVVSTPGVEDVSLTTNGLLLEELAAPLRAAGLRRINVSLDTLVEEKFVHVTRREGFHQVARGLEAAAAAGFSPVKINCVVLRGFNEDEVADFALLARDKPYQIRFIEYMPLGGDREWDRRKVVPAKEIVERIRAVAPLEDVLRSGPADPAKVYRFRDGLGEIGVIASVTEPFCFTCDRIRLTADGKLRTCLFAHVERDVRALLRGGAPEEAIAKLIADAVRAKEPGHMIDRADFQQPARAMHAIGG